MLRRRVSLERRGDGGDVRLHQRVRARGGAAVPDGGGVGDFGGAVAELVGADERVERVRDDECVHSALRADPTVRRGSGGVRVRAVSGVAVDAVLHVDLHVAVDTALPARGALHERSQDGILWVRHV